MFISGTHIRFYAIVKRNKEQTQNLEVATGGAPSSIDSVHD